MDQWLFGRSDDFLDHPGGRCRRTLKSVGTLIYFDEIGVLRDFLENQRDDRGRTIIISTLLPFDVTEREIYGTD